MTPAQLAKSGTESGHQRAVFCWAAVAANHGFDVANAFAFDGVELKTAIEERGSKPVPELEWLHHIPNGGSRGDSAQSRKIRGAQLKAEGVKTGVSDLMLPVKRGEWSGLYIEMKKPGGKPSRDQVEFGNFVKSQGYGFVVCDNWEAAVKVLEEYLSWMG
jgi:hypothetical protein